MSTYEMGEDRTIRPNGDHPPREHQLLDLEIRDDGGLRLFCAAASAGPESSDRRLHTGLIGTLTLRVLQAAVAVSDKTDYQGAWAFGLALRGRGTVSIGQGVIRGFVDRRIDVYDETVNATMEELRTRPDEIARSLLTRLYRAFGFLDQVPGLPGPYN
ncbi:MAG: hypothetical protein JF886_08440 [Candidatus Dormibacteraeota bacterium]|uniref:Uncharacterized protein n=1 Tax=Candidatus Aeolococcus gillhamiae TaxID=3127015 RepID=A0A934N3Q7_9BACT|nr:hypothetical protein [Candidatus Dormibacteraeota bacterium]